MIGLDTNLLLRFFLQDNTEQGALAQRIIAEHCTIARPGYINLIVLSEFVWVVGRSYKLPRDDIAALIADLLQAGNIVIADEVDVAHALEAYRNGADFVDALIAASNISAGCTGTLTLDRRAAKRAGMMLAE